MDINQTPTDPDALLSLVERVKENYQEPPPSPPKRGKQRDFSALSFLLLAVVAVTMRTFRDSELRKLLEKDPRLRQAMGFPRVPHRTCIGRRLAGLVLEAEQQIALLGQRIVDEVKPAADQAAVSVVDGRMYKAQGPLWHKKDREQELVPVKLRNVDTESKWSKSGYRGWVQGYRLLLQGLAFPEPVPIFAAWRPNNENEAQVASAALEAGALKVTSVLLGDETFGGGAFPQLYAEAGGWVLAPQQLPEERRSWKDDLYDYRKETIELLFQRIMQAADLKECRVKGEGRNGAFVFAFSQTTARANRWLISKSISIAPAGASQVVDCIQL
ncbi:MAG: hypothetical protein LC775_19395 [Acidobacteria bacterium]|nr:hypothetical protein [Acidobacteriota bacterium]